MANALMKHQIPFVRLILYLVMIIFLMIVGGIITGIVVVLAYDIPLSDIATFMSDYSVQDHVTGLAVINAGTQVFGFLIASLLFAVFFGKQSVNSFWLKFTGVIILLAPIVMILANPLIGISIEFNNFLIPKDGWLESIFKPLEDQAALATQAMLKMPDLGSLFKNLILIALIPAVSEEFVFRGVVQSQIAKWTKNVHLGIWISAFLFSAIHLQFYGFIPRMLMGALLGYLLVWTGSIWAPILAHFSNNAVAVLSSYYVQHQPGLTDEAFEQQTNTLPLMLIGIVLFIIVLWFIWKNNKWESIKERYLYEESDIPVKY